MTVLGDAIAKQREEQANDVNNFIWKGPKVNGIQIGRASCRERV